jgi:folate-binding protein YgfZ
LLDAAEWDLLRILYGIPAYGKELDLRFNPYEAGLDRYISREKGCYVGQEVLARIETYRKDRKTLAGVVERWQETGMSGPLFREGTQIGELTSVASIPYDGERVGLAVLPATAAEPGTVLATEQGREVTVSAIPMNHT